MTHNEQRADNSPKQNEEKAQSLANAFVSAAESMTPDEAPAKSWRDFVVDMTRPVPPPKYRIRIGGKGIIDANDLTTITGHAKNGKSQFLTIAAAVMLSGRPFGDMEAGDIVTEKLLFCDTEQSPASFQNNLRRLYDAAGWEHGTSAESHGLFALQLARQSGSDKMTYITQAIEEIRPDVVIIDGVRDLIDDFNDNTQTQYVMQWINALIDANPDISILPVLHYNPSGDKMRGALGTELENKSAGIVKVTKDNAVFTASFPAQRGEPVPDFSFMFKGNGELMPIDAPDLNGVPLQDVAQHIGEQFPDGGTRGEIIKELQKNQGLNQTKADRVFNVLHEKGWLARDGMKGKELRFFFSPNHNGMRKEVQNE